jgi:hypothetical protein
MAKGFDFVDKVNYGAARPRGVFEFKVLRADRAVVKEYKKDNLVVDGAFFQMARLLAGDVTGRNITKIGFGTGGDDPDPSDTALTGQYLRAVSGYEYPANEQVKVNWVLPVSEGNGMAIQEFGLFTADGTLFSRITLEEAVPKQAAFSIEGSWTIIFKE